MMHYIKKNLGNIANAVVVVGSVLGIVLWSHNGLSKEIHEIREDTKLANARIDDTNNRIDATNQRIDHTYHLILDILRDRKEGRD